MICPKCNMNIKDDAKFCIHCGTNFANMEMNNQVEQPVNTQPTQQLAQPTQPAQGVQPASNDTVCPQCGSAVKDGNHFCNNCGYRLTDNEVNKTVPSTVMQSQQPTNNTNKVEDYDKYYRAYFGSSYDAVMNGSFSLGTFLFGFTWLLLFKLYSQAGKLFLTFLGIEIVAVVIAMPIALLGLNPSLITIGASALCIVIQFNYAKDFNNNRKEKAELVIDDIIRNNPNEEDRLRLCKSAGGVNHIILALILLYVASLIFAIFFGVVAIMGTISRSSNQLVVDRSKVYLNQLKVELAAEVLTPVSGQYNSTNGKYYVLIDRSQQDTKMYPLNPSEDFDESDKGYIYFDNAATAKKFYVCLSSNFGDKKYVVSQYEYYLTSDHVNEKDDCDFKKDFPDKKDAIQLVHK